MVASHQIVMEKIRTGYATAWGFMRHLSRRYKQDGCRESAAALTYMSLFAVVPVMTLIYSVFSMVPAFQSLGDQVNDLIFKYFIPESGMEIQGYLLEFSSQARKLSAVGAIILVVTSYLMLANIEKTFNRIWGTVGNRRGLSGFLLYWGILSFGPLLVGIGLMMHTYLVSFQVVVNDMDALGVTALLLEYLPWLLTWIAFTLLFIAVPNCKVSGRFALVGGLVSTVLFQLAKGLFGSVIANSSYHSVYGAFAILPLFLLWIYLCWMIVLSSAELVRSLETFSANRGYQMPPLTEVVLICWLSWALQQRGKSLSDKRVVQSGLTQQHWIELRQKLIDNHFLEVTRSNHYVLTRDIAKITLWDLLQIVERSGSTGQEFNGVSRVAEYGWSGRLSQLQSSAEDQSREIYSVTLAELFTGSE